MAGIPVAFVAAAITVFAGAVPNHDAGGPIAVLAFAAYLAGLWVHYAWRWRRYAQMLVATYQEEETHWRGTRMIIDPTGISMTDPSSSSLWRWSGVGDVWVAAGFIIFRLGTNNHVMVPERLFAGPQCHRLLFLCPCADCRRQERRSGIVVGQQGALMRLEVASLFDETAGTLTHVERQLDELRLELEWIPPAKDFRCNFATKRS